MDIQKKQKNKDDFRENILGSCKLYKVSKCVTELSLCSEKMLNLYRSNTAWGM